MTPLLFGDRKKPLFGIYHPAIGKSARDLGVVICNPFGPDAVRAHRALRQLALSLAGARFHVLRFDYSGTGDSAGDGTRADFETWGSDIETASEELRGTAGVGKIAWVGLRLGGTLALKTAAGKRDVDRVVAWDPIIDGRAYLEQLFRRHEASERYNHRWEAGWKSPSTGPHDMIEVLGFPLATKLRDELLRFDLGATKLGTKKTAFVFAEEGEAHAALKKKLANAEGVLPKTVSWQVVEEPAWSAPSASMSSIVPARTIQAIVDWLSDGRP